MTDTQVKAALDDRQAFLLTLWGEARGEPIEGRIAVGCVVRNRVRTPKRFGASYRAVCFQRIQFSCWWQVGGLENYRVVLAQARSLLAGTLLDSLLRECGWIAEGIVDDRIRDTTGRATHYHAAGDVPAWAIGITPTIQIGGHLFYAGVR